MVALTISMRSPEVSLATADRWTLHPRLFQQVEVLRLLHGREFVQLASQNIPGALE